MEIVDGEAVAKLGCRKVRAKSHPGAGGIAEHSDRGIDSDICIRIPYSYTVQYTPHLYNTYTPQGTHG